MKSPQAKTFTMHRAALIDLLGRIPADQGNFTPWDGGMSFIKVADHLSGASNRLVATAQGQAPQPLEPSADLAAATQRLKDNHASVVAVLEGMSAEDFAKTVPAFGGREMAVGTMVDFMVQHEAHHKGQVWLMARMVGIEPGMFVQF